VTNARVIGAGCAPLPVKPAPPTVVREPVRSGAMGCEPTLGVDPASGDVLYQAWFDTYRVSAFDAAGPGLSTWTKVTPALTSHVSLDPILKTDPQTGRTFVSALNGACSLMAYTEDAGTTWTNVPVGCGPGVVFDHQSVGVGPYVADAPLDLLPHLYPNVVYYCAHDLVSATCTPSVDGGTTFLPAQVVYDARVCQPTAMVFGHLKTAPDGTAYLPPRYCQDPDTGERLVGVAVSEDNGLHWEFRPVPNTSHGDSGHGSLGVARDGTLYLSWGGKSSAGATGGPVLVSISHDKGLHWTAPAALGADFGIANSRFPVAVAGDGDRAVVAYLGSPTGGDATWQTVDVTPANPIQVGSVCTNGLGCNKALRNLLDFNDMVVDAKGRVFIAYTDGCIATTCASGHVHEAQPTLARLVGGLGVYAAYDGTL
jgi:hypothetical protein